MAREPALPPALLAATSMRPRSPRITEPVSDLSSTLPASAYRTMSPNRLALPLAAIKASPFWPTVTSPIVAVRRMVPEDAATVLSTATSVPVKASVAPSPVGAAEAAAPEDERTEMSRDDSMV